MSLRSHPPEKHPVEALAWAGAFPLCIAVDSLLGRWVLLPLFVAGFYGGMVVIDLLAYPFLSRWRSWLQTRGAHAWYLVEVGGMWIGTTLILVALSPWWLGWGWEIPAPIVALGVAVLALAVAVGTWGVLRMGLPRLLFAPALSPRGAAGFEAVPNRLVVEGPYRYVRNPLYDTDVLVMVGTLLLTGRVALLVVLLAYLLQLGMQIYLEESELKERFGRPYESYLRLVPRFLPRISPVDPGEIDQHEGREKGAGS